MTLSTVDGVLEKMESHIRWPEPHEDGDEFLQQIVMEILSTGYSLILMPVLSKEENQDLVHRVSDIKKWSLPQAEFEDAYMGRNNTTKYSTLIEDADDDLENTFYKCESQIKDLTKLLAPITESVFGFSSWGCISSMVRVPLASGDDEQALRPPPLGESDYEDGRVFGHLNFLERRKLSFLYLLQNSGGQVRLYGDSVIDIPIAENALLVFRHDQHAFSYEPNPGGSLALQTWILSEPWEPDVDNMPLAELPEHMEQDTRVSVISAHIHTAGSMNSMENYWTGLMAATDGQVHVPRLRWDHDLYYSQDRTGTATAKHGAFVDEDRLTNFDAAFYGMSEVEMPDVSPAQRLILDTGYVTLNLAGFTRQSLRGMQIGNYVGDSQSDWINLVNTKAATTTGYAGCMNSLAAMRLAYVFGTRGPCQHIDTACSSSMVALDRAHVSIKKAKKDQLAPIIGNRNCDQALVTGLSLCLDPHLYIGYSGAGMLSKTGRCFTFDQSANGFARGEGCAATFLQSSEPEKGHPEMMAALVGSFTNQDGRSANMTAPNGPSQTAATMASLEESGFSSYDVSACECHGTGTPLGDPIEFSALRAAFAKKQDQHPAPLPHSSAKTNIGHNEANAGLAGFAKCVMMVIGCTNPGNNHLRCLNSNLDLSGYPAQIGDEAFDFGLTVNSGLMGVSSFGSGGTNARADIWGRCRRGACKTIGIAEFGSLLRKRQLYFDRVDSFGKPGPLASDKLSLVGTWDAWSSLSSIPMMPSDASFKQSRSSSEYTAFVVLGETQIEQFHIIVNGDVDAAIHPHLPQSNSTAKIAGPDGEGKGLAWKIDGRADRAPPGTTYAVKFKWSFDWERGESMSISWDKLEDECHPALEYSHQYFVAGSWTSWKLHKMTESRTDLGHYHMAARIGPSGQEEFQIVRDRDWSQVIYPGTNHPIKTSVPVQGPDEKGNGKNWLVRGPPGFKLDVELCVKAGDIEVSLNIEKKNKKTWKNSLGNADNQLN